MIILTDTIKFSKHPLTIIGCGADQIEEEQLVQLGKCLKVDKEKTLRMFRD